MSYSRSYYNMRILAPIHIADGLAASVEVLDRDQRAVTLLHVTRVSAESPWKYVATMAMEKRFTSIDTNRFIETVSLWSGEPVEDYSSDESESELRFHLRSGDMEFSCRAVDCHDNGGERKFEWVAPPISLSVHSTFYEYQGGKYSKHSGSSRSVVIPSYYVNHVRPLLRYCRGEEAISMMSRSLGYTGEIWREEIKGQKLSLIHEAYTYGKQDLVPYVSALTRD